MNCRTLITVWALFGVLGGAHGTTAGHVAASNPNILPRGQAELELLSSLSSDAPHRIIAGQRVAGPGWPQSYNLFVDKLRNATGKTVALLGADYDVHSDANQPLSSPPSANEQQSALVDQWLIEQWKGGGLVMLTWQMDNPWYRLGTGEPCRAVPQPCVPGSLQDLLDPKNAAGAYFKAGLDIMAAHLETLQKAGVIVLFRPFHEMNGGWFWWGAQSDTTPSPADFQALWRYTFDYLTNVKRLNNVLWVFSPGNSGTQLTRHPWGVVQPAPYYYPGGQYVDVTALDYYMSRLTAPPAFAVDNAMEYSIPAYASMVALGKPFGLAELGPGESNKYRFDFDATIHELATDYPRVAFFCAWQDAPKKGRYLAIISNPQPEKLMNDPLVLTREAVQF